MPGRVLAPTIPHIECDRYGDAHRRANQEADRRLPASDADDRSGNDGNSDDETACAGCLGCGCGHAFLCHAPGEGASPQLGHVAGYASGKSACPACPISGESSRFGIW